MDATLVDDNFIIPHMTDKELVLSLMAICQGDSDLLIASLVLLNRQVPFEMLLECKNDVLNLAKQLRDLSQPSVNKLIEMVMKDNDN